MADSLPLHDDLARTAADRAGSPSPTPPLDLTGAWTFCLPTPPKAADDPAWREWLLAGRDPR